MFLPADLIFLVNVQIKGKYLVQFMEWMKM